MKKINFNIFDEMKIASKDWIGHNKKFVNDVIKEGNSTIETYKSNKRGVIFAIKNFICEIKSDFIAMFFEVLIIGIVIYLFVAFLSYMSFRSATESIQKKYDEQLDIQKSAIYLEGYNSKFSQEDVKKYLERYKKEFK